MKTGYAKSGGRKKEEISALFAQEKVDKLVIYQEGTPKMLQSLIEQMKPNDILLLEEIESLCNNSRELVFLLGRLKQRGIHLRSLREEWVDTLKYSAFKEQLAHLYEFEKGLLRSRRKGHVEISFEKRPGRKLGGIDWKKAEKTFLYYKKGARVIDIQKKLKISRTTVYKYLRFMKEKHEKA